MNKLIISLLFCLFTITNCFALEDKGISKIENFIINDDFVSADSAFANLPNISKDDRYYKLVIELETKAVIAFFKSSEEFFEMSSAEENAQNCADFYKNTLSLRAPSKIKFYSQKVIKKLNNTNSLIINKYNGCLEIVNSNRAKSEQLKKEAREAELQKIRADEKLRQETSLAENAAYIKKIQEEEKNRQAAFDEQIRKTEEDNRIFEINENKKEADLKKKCGKDYKQIRIGMSFKRVEKCVGDFDLTAQINRKDGIIFTYENDKGYVHVMNGVVVAWGFY